VFDDLGEIHRQSGHLFVPGIDEQSIISPSAKMLDFKVKGSAASAAAALKPTATATVAMIKTDFVIMVFL
jgi:hypothetical protein